MPKKIIYKFRFIVPTSKIISHGLNINLSDASDLDSAQLDTSLSNVDTTSRQNAPLWDAIEADQ